MAIVIIKGNTYHIQWYDRIEKKIFSKTTKLKVSVRNKRRVMKIAEEIKRDLDFEFNKLCENSAAGISVKDAFNHFLENNKHKHKKTIKNYYAFYKLFVEFFSEDELCVNINKLSVEEFIRSLRNNKRWQQNTLHTYVTHCIHFLNFLFEYSYTSMFKINRDIKTRPERKEKIIFSDDDIVKILNNLQNKNSNFKTLIVLLFYTGLRPSDLMTIQCEKIDLKNHSLRYYSPKRKIHKEIPFHSKLIQRLTERISEVKTGKLLNYNSVENIGRAIGRYLIQLGINDKGYSTRTFRKTFITLCRNRFSIDASIVRELVGHEHTNTADRHYNLINMDAMRNELKKFTF